MFKVESMHDYHKLSRTKKEIDESIQFWSSVSITNPKELPELRLHLKRLKELQASMYEALEKYKKRVEERILVDKVTQEKRSKTS